MKSEMKKLNNPHDKFFKRFYSHPKFAFEIFRLVFSKKELLAYEWNKLKTEKDTFKDKMADLVFSVPFKKKPKLKVKIFILLEHKSSYDRQLFTQLLNYQTLIHERAVQETGYSMPVIPVLFYHGKKPWSWGLSFQEVCFKEVFSEIPFEYVKLQVKVIGHS